MSARQSPLSCDAPACDSASRGDDLPALRLVTVPDTGPPFDADPLAGAAAAPAAAAGQRGSGWEGPGAGIEAGRDRVTPPGTVTDAQGEWPRHFAWLLAEALAGARPARQILPWTSERARVHFRRLTPLFGCGQRPRVLRVITTRPAPGVIEMTAVVLVGARTRALALRLEQAAPLRLPGPAGHARQCETPAAPASVPRWVCTDIEAA